MKEKQKQIRGDHITLTEEEDRDLDEVCDEVLNDLAEAMQKKAEAMQKRLDESRKAKPSS